MNNISFRKYQKKALDNHFENISRLLFESDENNLNRVLFRAPTGSGKTVMVAGIIDRLVRESDHNLSFVWISKGILADQSKEKLEEYLGGGAITNSSLEDILDNEIKQNEILFVNWEKIFSKANKDNPDKDVRKGDPLNKFMKDNEWDRNLSNFCENARFNGRKIVLIIDESHLNITKNTIEIIDEIIKPSVQLDITATPKSDFKYAYGDRNGEYIELDEVRAEEIIKKEVVINSDISQKDLQKSEKSGDHIVFEKAIKQREVLEELYTAEKSKVRPLVLIQLPNEGEKLSTLDKQKIDFVEETLDKKGFTYKNGKLAKWLSGDDKNKINLEGITNPDNSVDFLIFKMAPATGWDCPRAHILVKFRETKSEIFEIQTVGRIMRMPEHKYYEHEDLNRAYVYANLEEIKIDETALEYLKTQKAVRKDIYKNLDLESAYLMRGEYNDLMLSYRKHFFNIFLNTIGGDENLSKAKSNFTSLEKYKTKDGSGLRFDINRIEENLITNEVIDEIDKEGLDIRADESSKVKISNDDIDKMFIGFLKANCGEYNKARSFEKIRASIYQVCDKFLETGKYDLDDRLYIQKFVLSNRGFFKEIIDKSIQSYSKTREKAEKTYKLETKWNIIEVDYYPKSFELKKYKKCIMDPCFVSTKWKTEMGFIENYLESKDNDHIDWWYKNGDSKNEIYLGIPYTDKKGKPATFYPDFIVKYKNGRLGIFDTKSGQTAEDENTKLKSDAFQKYAKKHKDRKIFGVIVRSTDKDMEDWEVCEDTSYDYEKGNWQSL